MPYVSPKTDCPHALLLDTEGILRRFNEATLCTPCSDCHDLSENWFCFSCENVYCSRYVRGHMAEHNAVTEHCVAFSFSDASVWCYECDSYITNPNLSTFARHFSHVKHGDSGSISAAPIMPAIDEQDEDISSDVNGPDEDLGDNNNNDGDGDGDGDNEESPFTYETLIRGLRERRYQRIAVLTGAGISVAAGIPDFRSPGTGLYSRLQDLGLPYAEAVFQLDYFRHNPKPFYEVAKWFLTMQATPVKAHKFIKALDRSGQLMLNFTQNIDGLELQAGLPVERLVQAHGHMRSAHCIDCKAEYAMEDFFEHLQRGSIFYCQTCVPPLPPTPSSRDVSSTASSPPPTTYATSLPVVGTSSSVGDDDKSPVEDDDEEENEEDSSLIKGLIKPDIVFFGEMLPSRFTERLSSMMHADLVLVLGTSLKVYPFAALVSSAFLSPDTPVVLINRENPGLYRDARSFLFLPGDIEDTVQQIAEAANLTL